MTQLPIKGDMRSTLTHLAAFGLAAILDARDGATTLVETVRDGAVVHLPDGMTTTEAGCAVKAHAEERLESWVTRTRTAGSSVTGVMSPRGHGAADPSEWRALQQDRQALLDEAYATPTRWLDLAFMSALGEPAYWFADKGGKLQPDRGASGWEMKTRNKGADLVANRLSQLCKAVAARSTAAVVNGLTGESPRDEVGNDAVNSRTPSGLSAPGPTDNALAWCALWGVSQLPVAHNASPAPGRSSGRQSLTTGMLRGLPRINTNCRAYVYLPLFDGPVKLSRVRTVLLSASLARRAALFVLQTVDSLRPGGLPKSVVDLSEELDREADTDWLRRKRCGAVLLSYLHASDNKSAPELHVTTGTVHPLRS